MQNKCIINKWKENIHFILVNPKEPGNIGASARAIKNMGFSKIELVNPPENFIEGHDFWLASHATDVLNNAIVYNTLYDAIKEKSLIVGTSRRTGKKRGLILPLKESVKEILKVAKTNKVAILFGREDRGLSNEEVIECGFLIYIPTSQDAPSLNLAQSVLLVAYELSCQTIKSETPEFVQHKELNILYEHIKKTLKILGYIPKGNINMEERIMRNLKHILGRAGLTAWEVRMLHGICTQIEKKIINSN